MSEIDLTSPEVKAAIAEAVAEEVKGLKAKNAELIEANKKLRKGQEVDPAEFQALENERDELRSKLSDATRAANKAQKDLEAANKRASDSEAAFNRTFTDSQLTDALTKAGVTNPVHLKAAKALLASGVQVVVEGESRAVKAGDKPLADHVTEWAKGDEGKHFVTASESSGGGAQGGGKPNHTADMGGDKNARTSAIRQKFNL